VAFVRSQRPYSVAKAGEVIARLTFAGGIAIGRFTDLESNLVEL